MQLAQGIAKASSTAKPVKAVYEKKKKPPREPGILGRPALTMDLDMARAKESDYENCLGYLVNF